MNRLATAATLSLLLGAQAAAQSLPAPQFATPPANDNSNAAATTAWVRALTAGLGGGGGGGGGGPLTGDASAATVLAPGSTTARSLAARAGTVFNVLDYGARADGTTDLAIALNTIAAKLHAGASNVVLIPAGNYALKSAVVFDGVAPVIEGQGFTAGPAPASGTMITISGTGYVPITFQGVNARGAALRDIAFRQAQPATGPGWAPTDYDYVVKVLNALGEVTFDRVLFAGVTRGIYADNSGRLNLRDVAGQFYTAGVEIDDCYDIPRIEHLHAWTYQSADPSVVAWQEANQDTLILRRVDGIFVGDLFSLGARSALHLTSGANGVTTKFYVGNLYADFVKYGIWIDGAGTSGQIANATTQHNDQTDPGTRLPGGKGMLVDTTGATVQVSNWRTDLVETSAIDIEQSGNRVDVAALWVNGYNALGTGAPAVNVADSGTAAPNVFTLAGQPALQNGNGGPLLNSGNGASARSVLMNLPGAPANEPRFYAAAAGNPVSASAIGPDANIDFYLGAKGPSGSVRLRAQNSTVLRLDSPGPGDTDLLLRSGTAAASFIAESGSPNADISVGAKGTGSVRLQSGAASVLRTTSAGGTDTSALVTAGIGAATLSVENASAAADLVLAGQGANNGVRLLANGGNALRVDNPNSGNSDLLVRPGAATINLITESGAANADMVLAAKGSGSLRLLSGGATALRVTNPGTGTTDALVTSGAGSVTLAPENTAGTGDLLLAGLGGTGSVRLQAGGTTVLRAANSAGNTNALVTSNAGSVAVTPESATATADLLLGGLGTTGGVRLQAQGATVLRADSPAAGNSDLLVRSGTDTVSLTVESPNANANLVLNPKGSGTVVVPTVALSDNSTNAASTAWVKSTIAGSTAGVASFNARSGAVTLGAVDVTTALGFTPYSAANPAGYITASGAPVQSVAGRTGAITLAVGDVSGAAPLASPALTGAPTAPTPAAADNSTALATTAFVKAQGYLTAAPVTSVAGRTGAITLAVGDVSGAAPLASPVLTGTPAAPTPATADNSTALATTAYVKAQGYLTTAPVTSVAGRTGAVTLAVGDVSGAAPLASPTLTGTPTAPTPATADNSTALATTAYVKAQGYLTTAPVTSVAGRTGAITLAVADVTGAAPKASPTLTGTTTINAQTNNGLKVLGGAPGGTGIANANTYVLIASTTSTATTRLTVDGNAPGSANCINPAANTALDLFVEVVGIDTTAAGNVARYRALDALLYRGATAASTQLVNGASAAAPNGSIGTGSTAAFTVAADTTNGCLALSVAAPNADTWHWAARIRSTEVQ